MYGTQAEGSAEGTPAAKPSKSRPAEIVSAPHSDDPHQPEVFEMDAEDTSSEEPGSAAGTPESRRNQLKKALARAKPSSSAPAAATAGTKKTSPAGSSSTPGLTSDELADYERIESQFKAFRSRQVDLENSVATLLSRLNTQVKIPSSVASSEGGDLTSMASSEWDTESCGLTEDGLSILGSHAGTPPGGSPRADGDRLPPLQRVMQQRDGFPKSSFAASSPGPLSWAELQERLRQHSESRSSGSTAKQPVGAGMRTLSQQALNQHALMYSNSGESGGSAASQQAAPIRSSPPLHEGQAAKAPGQGQNSKEGPPNEQPKATTSGLQPKNGEAVAPQAPECVEQPQPSLDAPEMASPSPAAAVGAGVEGAPRIEVAAEVKPTKSVLAPAQPEMTPESILSAGTPPKKAWQQTEATTQVSSAFPDVVASTPKVPGLAKASSPVPNLSQLSQNITPPGARGLAKFGVADTPRGDMEEDVAQWKGWSIIATPEGRLFFFKEQGHISEWSQPQELNDVLGEWEESDDEYEPGRRYWRNHLLGISLWKDPRTTTNIFQAALDGNLFFLQMYCEVDGDLDVLDARGRSALHYAAAGGAAMSALFLLQHRVEVNLQDEDGATPLIFSCRYGYASVVKVLLDARANLHLQDSDGNTALHGAAAMAQLDCCNLLLMCGAEMRVANNVGETPEGLAARSDVSLSMLQRYQYRLADGLPPASSPSRLSPQKWEADRSRAGYRYGDNALSSQGAESESAEEYEEEEESSDSDPAQRADGDDLQRSQVGFGLWGRIWGTSDGSRPSLAEALMRPFKRPVEADLGMPNNYIYNQERKEWELRR